MTTTAIVFDHRGRSGQGLGPVEIRVTIDRNNIYYISTGVRVHKENFVCGTIVGQIDAPELNERVAIIYKKVQAEINRYIAEDAEIDIVEIRRRIKTTANAVSGERNAFLDFFEEQEKIMGLAPGTMKHYKTTRTRLVEYGMITRWSDVTAENICKWDAWLHQLKRAQSEAEKLAKEPEQTICDAAVYNYHKNLKAILNRAVLFGKIDRNPYDRLRGQFKRGDKESVEYLTEEEMKAVESLHPVAGTMMAIARDLFVFQMHTGLAYADTQVFDFRKYRKVDGRWCNVGNRVKTGVQYVTMLSNECEAILEKYGWQLPKIGLADYNKCLKALGAAVGIDKPLHSHLARHSFATMMIASGAAIQNVSRMLGHKDLKNTQRYAKVLPESVFADFKNLETRRSTKKRR